jgi:REP element-mobilizing transposase RayT
MTIKWINRNLLGALHFVTTNCHERRPIFLKEENCLLTFHTLKKLRCNREFKLIAYALMPDHCHLIVNPRDGDITGLVRAIKGESLD